MGLESWVDEHRGGKKRQSERTGVQRRGEEQVAHNRGGQERTRGREGQAGGEEEISGEQKKASECRAGFKCIVLYSSHSHSSLVLVVSWGHIGVCQHSDDGDNW